MKTLMVQGTTSDAGKSTLVAGLCRVFSDLNRQVAPFKPQNMALNSAVTADGGEIGRAQALQAVAARQTCTVDMNPILLKPNSDTGAQVIVHGRAISNMEAASYHDYKQVAMEAVLTSHQRLSEQFEYLIVEGAGSPAEINLRENDIANMGYAEAVDCPVIIIADIDKGGVFAHLAGTLALLSESEQARVKGFVINRFRGDIGLLQSGLDWLEDYTGKPVLGVLPYLHDLKLDAEDAISHQNTLHTGKVKVVILLIPHISNHTDFDPLALHPDVDMQYVRVGDEIPACDLIILPGSKNVIADLAFVKEQGWHQQILSHLRYGGKLMGICGGYQMLGNVISDPLGIESNHGEISGLQLLPMTTELTEQKALTQVQGLFELAGSASNFVGYEIHCGVSRFEQAVTPVVVFDEHPSDLKADGVQSTDGQIIGTYIHGLFDKAEVCQQILAWVNPSVILSNAIDIEEHREIQLNKLAEVCSEHIDIEKIEQILLQGA